MKRFLLVCGCLLVVLLAAGGLLYANLTAKTAPLLPEEPIDPLPGQVMSAMLTGEEVAVTQGQLNGLLALLPPQYREHLQGVELTGENTAVLWAETGLFGQSCDVRAQVRFSFHGETTEILCTVEAVQVGRVHIPEKLVETMLEEGPYGLDFSGKSIIINGKEIIRAVLQTDAAVIRDLRCDEHAVYLTPMGAGALLGSFLGVNF